MHARFGIVIIIALTLAGASVALAQDATTVVVNGQPTELVTLVEVVYGNEVYDIDPRDGPVITIVRELRQTTAGVEVRGIVILRDEIGWRVAGPFVEPAPATLAGTDVDQVLILAGGRDE